MSQRRSQAHLRLKPGSVVVASGRIEASIRQLNLSLLCDSDDEDKGRPVT